MTILSTSLAVLLATSSARAQDDHSGHEHHQQGDHARHADHAQHARPEQAPPAGRARGVIDLDAARNASGTAWQPELTPHAAFHGMAAGWQLMFHTLLFAGYDWQLGDRGDHMPVGVGWVMGMAGRRFATGSLLARVMLSPEPWTAQHDGGYPLLLQTGETWKGVPLHDRQHPHDLFMEVALMYTQALGETVALQLYLAPAGEPALGPVAFPHRQSASSDPLAAIVHHWQDSTHITFGVVTAGLVTRWFKVEGSWFNGREPDETRYDFDLRVPDAFSVRASVAPSPSWSGQVSYGYLPDHELLHPGEPVHKGTASAMYHRPLAGGAGHWATTAVLGLNKHGHTGTTPAFLLESNLDLDGNNVFFGRLELVQKNGEELVLDDPALGHESFLLGSLALGYLRNLPPFAGLVPGIGLRAAVSMVPEGLRPFYGSQTLFGGVVYLRLAVAPMRH